MAGHAEHSMLCVLCFERLLLVLLKCSLADIQSSYLQLKPLDVWLVRRCAQARH